VAACAACTSSASPVAHPPGVAVVPVSATAAGPSSFYRPPVPLPPAPPGTLIRSEIVSGVGGIEPGATLWRILYHSSSVTGADIAVSGYVVVPAASPPVGGYPVMAWAHGTTGAAVKCAPSLVNGLEGEGPYLVPGINSYLKAGWLIAATDYQGLGVAAGIHPYLVGRSEGYGVLDAARAARQLPGLRVSPTTLIYGHSQGGQAALFAGELAPGYAPSLHVIGVVAAAPATGLSIIVDVFGQSSAPTILAYFALIGWTWSQVYPDLPASDLFTAKGVAFAQRNVTEHCDNGVVVALMRVRASSLFRPGASADPAFDARARLNDPGQVRTPAPMLVVQGTADNQVPVSLTDLYVSESACPVGDQIEYVHYPGAGHGQVTFEALPQILSWSAARLHGTAAPSTCGRGSDSITPSAAH
jgi:pimeloyl-ACP methyl ester carboxylesterase